jgi:Putative abortive phage resistance protein AbiGi, antitoxin
MTKKLVGNNSPDWEDMSDYVVHFTKASENRTAYENSLSILGQRKLEARNRFGVGREFQSSPECVCLSEIPLHHLGRLAIKRGSYGIGFKKEFVVQRDGGPILYAYKGTEHAKAMKKLVAEHQSDPTHSIWRVAPFVDVPGVYNSEYCFEWEREWRLTGDLEFEVNDPAFLIIPDDLHKNAREFFDVAEAENVGPNYQCKFIDPYWDKEKIAEVLT